MTERVHSGTGVTPLADVGTARWYEPDADLTLPEPPESVDPAAERERFEAAREAAREELAAERAATAERAGESEAAIFEAHAEFLDDPRITEGVTAAVDDGLPAPRAVERAFGDAVEEFEAAGGRVAERADDLRDVRDRLVRLLLDRDRTDLAALPEGTVLLAERLTPSDTARLDPGALAGFATVAGGPTAHAAIMARSLALPAVVGVGEGLRGVGAGERALVDGTAGVLVAEPAAERVAAATAERDVEVRHEQVATADGRAVEVAANVGTPGEAEAAADSGADGIGLFRTEFLFLDRENPPDEDEQYEAYTAALDAFEGDRVVVRTLDAGGDKPIPYLGIEAGANPFLGVRGVRTAPGRRPDLFETQVRALLRAAAIEGGDALAIMLPLVATVRELDDARARIEAVAADLAGEGIDHAVPELGVMIETPASTYLAAELAERVDFLSVGTNDLTQYLMAATRDDERVADLHDPLHPAVLRAIDRAVEGARAGDAWIGMCGEMAGDPALAELLVGLGFDELSASAVVVPEIKARVAGTDAGEARELAERVLGATTREEVRALLDERTVGE